MPLSGEPVTIRNHPDGQTTFRRTSGSGGFVVFFESPQNIVVDGTGSWTGKTAGAECGRPDYPGDTSNFSTDGCGIVGEITGSASPSSIFRIKGRANNVVFKGVGCSGNWNNGLGNLGSSCLTIHDVDASSCVAPGSAFIEDIEISDMYMEQVGGTGLYIGPNGIDYSCTGGQYPWHLKDINIHHIGGQDMGGGFIRLKVAYNGTNSVHDTTSINTGNDSNTAGFQVGILLLETEGSVYANYVHTPGEHGIQIRTQQIPTSVNASVTVDAYNNIVIEGGSNPNAAFNDTGILVSRASTSVSNIVANIYSNTVVDSDVDGIETSSNISSSGRIEGNIVCGSGGEEIDNNSSLDTSDGNTTNADCANINFVDYANDNLKLSASSSAIDAATSGPSTDAFGNSRPLGDDYDDGAHEYGDDGGAGPPSGIAAKPACGAYTITADTYSPEQMWMFCEGSGTTVEDDGDGTDADLTLTNSPTWSTDGTHGGYLAFDSASDQQAIGSLGAQSGTVIFGGLMRVADGNCTDNEMWATLADASADNVMVRFECDAGDSATAVAWNADSASKNFWPADITDGQWHFVAVRASDTDLDVCVDDGSWDEVTISKTGLIAALDQIGFGVQASNTPQFHGSVDWAWAFMEESNFSGATCANLYNSGDWWANFGVDATGTAQPALSSVAVPTAGDEVDVTFDTNVTIGAGGNGGVTLTASGGAVALTFDACSTTTCTWSTDRTIGSHETLTIDYVQPGNGVEASTGGLDAGSFSGIAVTNNSTQDTVAPTLSSYAFDSDGDALTLTHSESVTCAGGGTCGYTISGLATAATLTYSSGSGTAALVFDVSRVIDYGESGTLTHTEGSNIIVDGGSNELASFSTTLQRSASFAIPSIRCADGRYYSGSEGDEVICPAVLAAITYTGLTSTQIDVGFTSTLAGGEATACVSTSLLTTPAQIRACSGGDKASITDAVSGDNSITVTGLTSAEDVYLHVVQDTFSAAAGGWVSTVISTASTVAVP